MAQPESYELKKNFELIEKQLTMPSEMEIKELLKNLDINKPVLLCPHGRPVISVVSKNQIEKWFKRIV